MSITFGTGENPPRRPYSTVHLRKSEPMVEALRLASFPGYTGQKFKMEFREQIRFADTQWSGGSRSEYIIIKLDGMQRAPIPTAPFMERSQVHETEYSIPPGYVVVMHRMFSGQDMGLTFFVNPATVWTPSLRMIARRWASTVRMEMCSRTAMSFEGQPSATSWSVMPVMLPLVTIMRRESSFIFMPSGARSSCAIRSKRGKVVSNCARRWLRTCFSMSWVQVSRRSHRRRASGCSLGAAPCRRASRSMASLLPRMLCFW